MACYNAELIYLLYTLNYLRHEALTLSNSKQLKDKEFKQTIFLQQLYFYSYSVFLTC